MAFAYIDFTCWPVKKTLDLKSNIFILFASTKLPLSIITNFITFLQKSIRISIFNAYSHTVQFSVKMKPFSWHSRFCHPRESVLNHALAAWSHDYPTLLGLLASVWPIGWLLAYDWSVYNITLSLAEHNAHLFSYYTDSHAVLTWDLNLFGEIDWAHVIKYLLGR